MGCEPRSLRSASSLRQWTSFSPRSRGFACRAGTSTIFFYGTETNQLSNYAWCSYNAGGLLHRVGEKLPNPFGLYDLYGNGWEWCLDWTGGITADPVVEPNGPTDGSLDNNRRVGRGGTIGTGPDGCRSAKVNPQYTNGGYGYRLLCPPTLKW